MFWSAALLSAQAVAVAHVSGDESHAPDCITCEVVLSEDGDLALLPPLPPSEVVGTLWWPRAGLRPGIAPAIPARSPSARAPPATA